jgi:hypothetical protein
MTDREEMDVEMVRCEFDKLYALIREKDVQNSEKQAEMKMQLDRLQDRELQGINKQAMIEVEMGRLLSEVIGLKRESQIKDDAMAGLQATVAEVRLELKEERDDKRRMEGMIQELRENVSAGKMERKVKIAAETENGGNGERDKVERAKQAVLGVELRFTGDLRISHPIQFLKTFDRITKRIGLTSEQRIVVLGEACLTGGALTWFLDSDCDTYEAFARDFEEKYWTSKEHNKLMDEVNSNILKLEKGELQSEYIGRIVREVGYLPYPMEDSYLAKRLIRKFNDELRNLLLSTVTSTEQLKITLSTLENEESQILKGRKAVVETVTHPVQNTWMPRDNWRREQYRNQNFGYRGPGQGFQGGNGMQNNQGMQGHQPMQNHQGMPGISGMGGNQMLSRIDDGSGEQKMRQVEPAKN